tara:strand:- start:150 stop:377 length:228 start_codon:yes stop_codon:yes gene_type:complete
MERYDKKFYDYMLLNQYNTGIHNSDLTGNSEDFKKLNKTIALNKNHGSRRSNNFIWMFFYFFLLIILIFMVFIFV